MHALYQRLRELDWDTFQRLAHQLLAEKYPALQIRHVEGSGGDQGLDLFSGQLAGRPIIWQCKHFPNGLTTKQRPQVVKSLLTALEHFRPAKWILVISVDLDAKGYKWFQDLQRKYLDNVVIELLEASSLVRELVNRRSIRDSFFPGAVLDQIAARRLIDQFDGIDSSTLRTLSNKYLDEEISRLEEKDARFNYRVTHSPNLGVQTISRIPLQNGLIASVVEGERRTDVFVRDVEAVRLDPPKLSLMLTNDGKIKFEAFVRTGKEQVLLESDMSNLFSHFDFIFPDKEFTNQKLILLPTPEIQQRVLSWKLAVSKGDDSITYDLVKFRIVGAGTEQIEVESVSNLPFVLTLTIDMKGRLGQLQITDSFEGRNISEVAKILKAKEFLYSGGTLVLHSLDADLPLGSLNSNEASRPADEWSSTILEISEVAKALECDFPVPDTIGLEDLNGLAFLQALLRGTALPIGGVTIQVAKSESLWKILSEDITAKFEVIASYIALESKPQLLGHPIEVGPFSFHSQSAVVADQENLAARYQAAAENEAIEIGFIADDFRAISFEENPRRFLIKRAEENSSTQITSGSES